jgi:uncharacterized protein (DUF58 family)
MNNLFKPVYFNSLFFKVLWGLSAFFVLAYFWRILFVIGLIGLGLFISLVLVDIIMLFGARTNNAILGARKLPERFSNGDSNEVILSIESRFPREMKLMIIDEVPVQFQLRDFCLKLRIPPNAELERIYHLTPVERGEYLFGALNVFVTAPIGFLSRRYRFDSNATIKVYPSFIQMKRYELMAISNRLSEVGIKKIRKIGHHTEFDQIREYIKGDDVRTINWKATARKGHLMVNQYQDEKSQQVFCVIDMGRTMKMPFNGMTLLDYSINTSLVISNIAMLKHDKAGLITFNEQVRALLPARQEGRHMQTIMDVLYNQQSGFLEHNLEGLYAMLRHKVHQRSLLILFTNFESLKSAQRELPILARLAANHLLMVVFFENTEIAGIIEKRVSDTEDIYLKATAEKFIFDKKQIVKELERNGIHAILTSPEKLTVDTMNRYLEFKSRGLI